uniref:Uncharacterized protein n=1 Tax=Oryza barthii TaxID=65489 RepID=A0A0D3HLZ3_9ORYZ
MERHPEKIAVAVFVTATMPAAGKPMSFAFKQNPDKTFLFGPEYLARRVYQLSPPEDLTLAMSMVRPSRRFLNDATMNGDVLTMGRYGAVR